MTCGVMLVARATAATPVAGGTLTGHSTWTAAASPYLVQADLTIASDADLELEPGVEVRFANHDPEASGLDPARVELVVEGALRAQGTSAAPILLAAAEGDFANSWSGLRVSSGAQLVELAHVAIEAATTAVDSTAPGSVLSLHDCVLRKSFDGLHLRAGKPTLAALSLESNSVSGLHAEAASADIELSLEGSVIRLNGSYGILLSASQGQSLTARIAKSTVYGNTSAGVTSKVQGAGSRVALKVTDSIVNGNGILGIDASALDGGAGTTTVRYSDVYGNGMDFSGATPGEGCIAADPSFVDAPWDLRLSAASPCIDSADPLGPVSDMGAYQYVPEVGGESGGGQGAGGQSGEAQGGQAQGGQAQGGEAQGGQAQGGEAQGGQAQGGEVPGTVPTRAAESGCSCNSAPHGRLDNTAMLLAIGLSCLRRRRSSA